MRIVHAATMHDMMIALSGTRRNSLKYGCSSPLQTILTQNPTLYFFETVTARISASE